MKLNRLFEQAQFESGTKYTVDQLNQLVNKHLCVLTWGHFYVYIITDVPKITSDQYDKLCEITFTKREIDDLAFAFRQETVGKNKGYLRPQDLAFERKDQLSRVYLTNWKSYSQEVRNFVKLDIDMHSDDFSLPEDKK